MVLALAGDSTMTSRPRPATGAPGLDLAFVDLLVDFPAARRGLADGDSGIVLKGLRMRRVMAKRDRGASDGDRAAAANGAEP